MARKNLFELTETREAQSAETSRRPMGRPLLGLDRPLKPASPVGAISQSLDAINSRATRATEIEKQLARGHAVVELDPGVIDASFVVDRLGTNTEGQATLEAQIREHGQQVPILVRPHPDAEGRYQVAYGHRRLAAVRAIGGTIKAVVRDLSDEQLVVSQGQENNSRADLSFIERCFFAAKLESKGFSRDVIMASLGVDKAALSRMIGLVNAIAPEIIEAIGPAPSFGRQRWAELAAMLDDNPNKGKARRHITEPRFCELKSDERFQALYDILRAKKEKPSVISWTPANGQQLVRITDTDTKLTLAFDKRVEPDFAAFVHQRLEALYNEFRNKKAD
jgi:ParB family chromosome partitioning protein